MTYPRRFEVAQNLVAHLEGRKTFCRSACRQDVKADLGPDTDEVVPRFEAKK